MATKSVARRKKAVRKNVGTAIAFVNATFNNTMITFSDHTGAVLAWSSSGSLSFKGSRKSTPYASSQVVAAVLERTKSMGITDLMVRISGAGGGRDAALRALAASGLNLTEIRDVTPRPHNGCRPKKVRRP